MNLLLRRAPSVFPPVSLLSDAFQRTTGNCTRLFTLRAKSLSAATAGERIPYSQKMRRDGRSSQSSREIIEIPAADASRGRCLRFEAAPSETVVSRWHELDGTLRVKAHYFRYRILDFAFGKFPAVSSRMRRNETRQLSNYVFNSRC